MRRTLRLAARDGRGREREPTNGDANWEGLGVLYMSSSARDGKRDSRIHKSAAGGSREAVSES